MKTRHETYINVQHAPYSVSHTSGGFAACNLALGSFIGEGHVFSGNGMIITALALPVVIMVVLNFATIVIAGLALLCFFVLRGLYKQK